MQVRCCHVLLPTNSEALQACRLLCEARPCHTRECDGCVVPDIQQLAALGGKGRGWVAPRQRLACMGSKAALLCKEVVT